jgi:hypothetical protein
MTRRKTKPLPIPKGKWVKAIKARVNPNGTVSLLVPATSLKKNVRKKVRNVAAGYVDEFTGQFHPLRASYDYSRSRGGDTAKRKPAKKKRKR